MKSFDKSWENKIYSRGLMVANYPYSLVVSLIVRNFFSIPFNKRKYIKMLDLGCGAWNHAKFFAENGFGVYGIEGSSTAIKLCRKKFNKLRLKGNFIQGDFIDLPYPDKFFDCVLDRESLYANKFEAIQRAIDQVYQKLKANGLFICFMYNSYHPDKKFGKRIERNTYNNFNIDSGFHNTGIVHFTNLKEIKILFNKFKINHILRNSLSEVLTNESKLMQYDEYIIIARK
jgi:SAM-dependent methyltransferase